MAKTSKNEIYYNDDEESIADVLSDMKKLAESTDEAIEKSKYNDTEIKKEIESNTNNIKKIENDNVEQDTLIELLQTENKLLKEQIPSANASGNSIHIEDSSNLEFDWKIRGGHKQETRSENLYNKTTNTSGYLNQAGTIVSNGNWIVTDYIKVISKIKYYTAGNNYLTPGDGVYGAYYNANKELISTFAYSSYSTETTEMTTIENAEYIRFSLYKLQNNSETFDFYTDAPTPNYLSQIETAGNNVNRLDESKASVKTANGMTLSYSEKDGLILNGATTALTNFWLLNLGEKLDVGDYTLSSNVSLEGKGVYVLKDANSDLARNILKQPATFTSSGTTITDFLIQINAGVTFDNQKLEIKLEKGTVATPYSKYGKSNVKIDVINKNLVKINESDWELTNNNTIKNKARNQGAILTQFNMKANIKYKINLKLLSKPTTASTFTGFLNNVAQNASKSFVNINNITLNTVKTIEFLSEEDVEFKMNFSGNANSEIFEFQLWAELNDTTEYEQHKSQTAIMPVQQEMLEGDYLDLKNEKEHHEWKKLILTGDESWNIGNVTIDEVQHKQFYISQTYLASARTQAFSNTFKNNLVETNIKENYFYLGGNLLVICNVKKDNTEITTIEDWKTYLQQQNEAGTPVTIYYKLAEPVDLELTEEQKAVREQKLKTYKNITNINLSDELASIDIEYKKDIETMNKNIENRLAELESALIS